MRLISLDVRLHVAGPRPVSERRRHLHERITALCFRQAVHRIGEELTVAFNSAVVFKHALDVRTRICRVVGSRRRRVDAVLIDLSANSNDTVRESILFAAISAIDELARKGLCQQFVLCLPYLPIDSGEWNESPLPSRRRLAAGMMRAKDWLVVLAGADGNLVAAGTRDYDIKSLGDEYRKLLRAFQPDRQQILADAVVRRLGHFKTNPAKDQCRRYSFRIDRQDRALMDKLGQWWDKRATDGSALLYDAKSNPWFRPPILAFGERRHVPTYPINVVLTEEVERKRLSSRSQPCVLALDVVHTGQTLQEYLQALRATGLNIATDIVAAIAGQAEWELTVDDISYRVSSLVQRQQEARASADCPQCRLGLTTTSDADEEYERVRAFDFWDMAEKVGWQREQDVPRNIGSGYELMPRFAGMMEEFGDWLAWKMAVRIGRSKPTSFFILHPDEHEATAVSERLRARFDKNIVVVRVPRPSIVRAQSRNNDWKAQLTGDNPPMWLTQLRNLRQSAALVIDVFNGSGSTFRTLHSLLAGLDIPIYAYFPFVDRDPASERSSVYVVPKWSLYDWYGPRRLRTTENRA